MARCAVCLLYHHGPIHLSKVQLSTIKRGVTMATGATSFAGSGFTHFPSLGFSVESAEGLL